MRKGNVLRRIAILLSVVALLASTVNTTYGYIVTSTGPLVNIFRPDEITVSGVTLENVVVKGIKVLEGRDWKEGDTFTFKLEQQIGDKWNELGKKTITYDANKKDYNIFEFTDIIKNISFDKVGTYEFRMSEVVGTLENMEYDKSVNRFTIKVTDVDMDGQLEVNQVEGFGNSKVTTEEDVHTIEVTFNNKFVPPVIPDPTPIKVPIRIEKTIENKGDIKLGTEGFEIVLENLDTGEMLSALTNTDGSAMFELSFTKDDIDKEYRYKLYETHAGKKGMTYDDTEYDVVITIERSEDNKLVASINGFAAESFVASFHNIYKMSEGTGPATGDVAQISYGFVMMIVSAATLIALLITDREKKEEIKE